MRAAEVPTPDAATMFEVMLHRNQRSFGCIDVPNMWNGHFFFPNGGIKLFVSKIYFLLHVALAGQFCPQCGSDAPAQSSITQRGKIEFIEIMH